MIDDCTSLTRRESPSILILALKVYDAVLWSVVLYLDSTHSTFEDRSIKYPTVFLLRSLYSNNSSKQVVKSIV